MSASDDPRANQPTPVPEANRPVEPVAADGPPLPTPEDWLVSDARPGSYAWALLNATPCGALSRKDYTGGLSLLAHTEANSLQSLALSSAFIRRPAYTESAISGIIRASDLLTFGHASYVDGAATRDLCLHGYPRQQTLNLADSLCLDELGMVSDVRQLPDGSFGDFATVSDSDRVPILVAFSGRCAVHQPKMTNKIISGVLAKLVEEIQLLSRKWAEESPYTPRHFALVPEDYQIGAEPLSVDQYATSLLNLSAVMLSVLFAEAAEVVMSGLFHTHEECGPLRALGMKPPALLALACRVSVGQFRMENVSALLDSGKLVDGQPFLKVTKGETVSALCEVVRRLDLIDESPFVAHVACSWSPRLGG